MQKVLKNIILPTLIVFLLLSGVMSIYKSPSQKTEEIALSSLVRQINEEVVKKK